MSQSGSFQGEQYPTSTTWLGEARLMFSLGLPLITAQLAQMLINVTNTIMLGRLGPDELAASVLGWQLFFVIWMFGTGFGFAVMPLVANAVGSRSAGGVARYVHMGLLLCFLYAVFVMPLLWFSESAFLFLGQEKNISKLAAEYVRALQWSLFPQLVIIALRSLLGALHKPNIVVIALVGGASCNFILNLLLVFGFYGLPALGMTGAGLATFISTSLVALFLVLYSVKNKSMQHHKLFSQSLKPDIHALKEVFRLGWPIGITIVAEVALFTAMSFMMGWMGSLELAAHGIALQLSGITFMIPLGLSAAATVRVGWAFGAHNRTAVERSAKVAVLIGIGVACVSATIFVLFPEILIGFYLDLNDVSAQAVIPYATSFLLVAAAFQIVDGIQVLANGALRG